MSHGKPTKPASWAGVPQAERKARRRALLIDAALTMLAEESEQALSVRSLSRAVGMNTRYFYENFADVDELLAAAFDEQLGDLVRRLVGAVDFSVPEEARAAAGAEVLLRFFAEDRRRGAILFTAARSRPVLVERRDGVRALMIAQADVLSGYDPAASPDPVVDAVMAAALYGVISELIRDWLEGKIALDVDRMVEVVTTVVNASLTAVPALRAG